MIGCRFAFEGKRIPMAVTAEGCALGPQGLAKMFWMKRDIAFGSIRREMTCAFNPCHRFDVADLLQPGIRVELAQDCIAAGI